MDDADTTDYTDPSLFNVDPIPVHGVVAPEDVPTGDKRGFNAGSMTRRPLRLPFSDQRVSISGHDGSVVVGSVDRLMRKDGMVHWEGSLMPSPEADDLVGRMQFFDGRYGVSVDGDNGSIDMDRSMSEEMLWFDKVRASGLTAVAIPAFHEAYVGFGLHPSMPDDNVLTAAMYDAGDLLGGRREEFKRGPGWVTDPKATNRIHDYWTKPGQPGYEKIGWGKPGDFARAKALIGAKIAEHSPDKMRFLNQIIAQWHHDALGYWPATHAKMDRAGAKAAAHGIEMDAVGQGWEAVITASAGGGRATPPAHYFTEQEGTGALVVEEPDEFGFRHTYGFVGEWGVCHIGHDGRCVEVPDPGDDYDFPEFHLGRTKTTEGYVNTGVITFKVDHRDAQRILTETAEQQHFDNVANAWAAVRVGTNGDGMWFSGVVLPGITEDDLTLIEATGQVSGEWKYGAMRALQSVNTSGFPVLRSSSAAYDDEGNVVALVASLTGSTDGCAPTPAERMAALASIDAEVRMDALRAEFNWSDVAENLMAEAQDEGRVKPVGLRDDGAVVYEQDGEVPGTDTIVEPYPGES